MWGFDPAWPLTWHATCMKTCLGVRIGIASLILRPYFFFLECRTKPRSKLHHAPCGLHYIAGEAPQESSSDPTAPPVGFF